MSNTIKLSIPGMKCNGCVSAIEKALGEQAGVIKSEVDLASKSALIESDASLVDLLDAIKTAGFDATELAATDQGLSA
jgi:Cu+-exporting ATPase